MKAYGVWRPSGSSAKEESAVRAAKKHLGNKHGAEIEAFRVKDSETGQIVFEKPVQIEVKV